jgi:hypothetical protein
MIKIKKELQQLEEKCWKIQATKKPTSQALLADSSSRKRLQ